MTTRARAQTTRLLGIAAAITWLAVAAPPLPRPGAQPATGQAVTVLPDGRRLVTGGLVGGRPVGGAAIVDPRTGLMQPLPDLGVARAWHSATLLPDGTVLVFGWLGAGGRATGAAEVIDPA